MTRTALVILLVALRDDVNTPTPSAQLPISEGRPKVYELPEVPGWAMHQGRWTTFRQFHRAG
jgi:hypothetical protein